LEHASSDQNRLIYFGGCSSPRNQPTASDFIGSSDGSRGSVYYLPRPVSSADLAIMRRLDQLHLEFPFAGSRMLRGLLAAEGSKIGRRHVKTLMRGWG